MSKGKYLTMTHKEVEIPTGVDNPRHDCYIAFRDDLPDSYMIISYSGPSILVNKGIKISTEHIPKSEYYDIDYSFGFYWLFNYQGPLVRRVNPENGETETYPLKNGGGWCGKFIRACKNRRLLAIKGTNTFEVIYFNEAGEFISYCKSPKNFDYMDICVFGRERSLVAGVWNGQNELHLYEVKIIGKRLDVKLKLKHKFKDCTGEGVGHGEAVTTCPNSSFIAVHLRSSNSHTTPGTLRIMSYNEKTHKLLSFHNIDCKGLNTRKLYSIKFVKYFGDFRLVLTSCNRDTDAKVLSFYLDLHERKIKLIHNGSQWDVKSSGFFKVVDAGNGKIGMINSNFKMYLLDFTEEEELKTLP